MPQVLKSWNFTIVENSRNYNAEAWSDHDQRYTQPNCWYRPKGECPQSESFISSILDVH